MSKVPAFLVLLVAILSGLFASASVVKYINQIQNNGSEIIVTNTQSVIIARQDIPSGTTLRSEHVAAVQRPKDTIPQGTFQEVNQVVGRMVKSSIYAGEFVLNERLVEPGSPSGLPALIPEGQRAITLKVDDTISVAGFVQPGHHVDIVGTLDVGVDESETISKVILQNIRVIATGQEIETKDEQKPKVVPTVTVLVTLDQAERLSLATRIGQVRLVLRNYKDDIFEETEGVKLSNLIPSILKDLPVIVSTLNETPVARPKYQVIEVYRGVQRTELSFPKNEL